VNRRNRTAVLATSAIVLALALAPAWGAGASPTAGASSYYEPCGKLTFKGTHKLFHHVVSCGKATRKSKFVLKKHAAPRGWRCSLDNLNSGYAACARGQRAFALFPV
jgi:hypothetical protein